MNAKNIKLKAINKKEEFYNLEKKWGKLVSGIKNRSLFHSYKWHKAYVDSLKSDILPIYYIAVYQHEELIAIFPIEIHFKNFFIFKFIVLRNTDCFFQDAPVRDFIIADAVIKDHVMEMLLNQISKQTGLRADCLIMDLFNENSMIWMIAQKAPPEYSIIEEGRCCYRTKLVSYDEMYRKYSKKHRKNLRLAYNRISKKGVFSFKTVRNKSRLKTALQEFIELEMSGWKGRKKNIGKGEGAALALDEEQVRFFNNLRRSFGAKNACEICTLKLDGKIISMLLSFIYNKEIYYLKIAYDEEYSKCSPAMLLFDLNLKNVVADKDIAFLNYLSDKEFLKSLDREKLSGYKMYIYSRMIKGRLYYWGTRLYRKLKFK